MVSYFNHDRICELEGQPRAFMLIEDEQGHHVTLPYVTVKFSGESEEAVKTLFDAHMNRIKAKLLKRTEPDGQALVFWRRHPEFTADRDFESNTVTHRVYCRLVTSPYVQID